MSNKPQRITSGVVHLIHDGALVTLRAGDEVPSWANIANPALFVNPASAVSETVDTTVTTTTTTTTVNSGDTGAASTESTPEPSLADLKVIAKSLGVSTAGKKADLAARIAEKQAESAPPAGGDDDEVDEGRAALEARLKERGIEFDENTTDDELEALLDDQE